MGGPLLTFLAAHVIMTVFFGFDIFAAFNHVRHDAATFNRAFHRPYLDFALSNIREFVVTSGVLLSLLALACAVLTGLRWRNLLRRRETLRPLGALACAAGASFFVLDLSGISRGEVARLWIFLAAFVAVVAGQVCALEADPRFFDAIVAGTILQTCLTIGRVGFAIQGLYVPGHEGAPQSNLTPLTEIVLVAAVSLACIGLRTRVSALVASVRSTSSEP